MIIPVKNGRPHLEFCLDSVLADNNENLEIVLSVDASSDGSIAMAEEYAREDSRIQLVVPPSGLTMSDHWDFAQAKASGAWQVFLGQDDLLCPNFSSRVIPLIIEAEKRKLEAIVARRAYVYWEPLNSKTTPAIQFWGDDTLSEVSSTHFASQALLTQISYHAGPQAYTSSIVSSKLLERIRIRNNGRLIIGHPQDAFLAAEILAETESFLNSGMPFSFVGTSKNSAGLAVAKLQKPGESKLAEDSLAEDYLGGIALSSSGGGEFARLFRHGCNAVYFRKALEITGWHRTPLPSSWPLGLRLRHDLTIIASGAQLRMGRGDLLQLVTSGMPLQFLVAASKIVNAAQAIQNLTIRAAAKLLNVWLAKRYSLVRVSGPLPDAEISRLCSEFSNP